MRNTFTFLKLLVFISLGCNCALLAQTSTFLPTGTIATYTVPAGATLLSITAKGSQGGQGLGGAGGRGAIMTGTFTAVPGHVLKVLVGERTTTIINWAGGGGGGSFVWDVTAGNVLLLAAGGGGGAGSLNGIDAVTTQNGTNGGGGVTYGGGGTLGGGGTPPTYSWRGAGGTGWLLNGFGGVYIGCSASGGGATPLTGGAGGTFGGNASFDGNGGFGGGGGSQGTCTQGYGGGGGGYSGGGGGSGPGASWTGGGGGGSFNGGSLQVNSVGNTGNGSVTITQLCVPPVGGTIVGPSTMCIADVITMTDPTATPAGFFGGWNWTSSTPTVATINPATGQVTAIAAGVDTIKLTINFTCGTATATKIITVNPLPTAILGVTDICPGSSSALADSTPGGTWSVVSTAIANIGSATGLLTGVAAGTATVSYTLATTNCSITKAVNVAILVGPPTVCAGDSIQMLPSVPGGTFGSVLTSIATANAASGWVTGVGMGVDTIHYTLPIGCTVSRLVTVNALAPILGVDSVCLGQNRFLTNIVGGGTWSSDASTIATVTFDSGKVTGLLVGTANISYVLPTGCYASVPFYVVDYPVATVGTTKACPGTTTDLVNATLGGWWQSGNTSVATVDASLGIVTGVSADTVSIYYTISPGCMVSTLVTINPLPDPILGSRVICPGTLDTLTDATPYGLWTSITPTIATVDSVGIVTSLLSTGNALIRYTLPITGCYWTATVTLDPLPAPTVTYNYLYSTLYATPGFATYQWYDSSGGKITGATAASIAAAHTDYYWVVVTDTNGCKGTSSVFYYNIALVGVKPVVGANGIIIYPNPANGVVNIESPVKVRAVITSLEGKTELEQADAKEINISSLPDGMYFISLYNDSGMRIDIQKLIKQ